jgi:hypothetical protein
MPRIIVTTDDADARITHTEWVSPVDFETDHFRRQFAERVAWAVDDAMEVEAPRGPRATSPHRAASRSARFHRLLEIRGQQSEAL